MLKRKTAGRGLAIALTLALTVLAPMPKAEAAPSKSMDGKLVIIHTNDTHGRDEAKAGDSIGTAGVAQMKKDYEEAGADVLLISAGDATQGKPLVNLSDGATAVEFMNLAGYDLMVPGNHELDYGFENLAYLASEAKFPMLAANVTYTENGENAFWPYRIFVTEQGYKVGVFGLATPETLTKANPDNVKGLSFAAGNELYACAQQQINTLRGAGCELIVAVGHLGTDEASAPNRSTDVLANTEGIDLFIDGHSHTEIDGGEKVGDALLVSTGEYLNNVGVVSYDGKKLSSTLVSAEDYKGGYDEAVMNAVLKYSAAIDAEYNQVFAKTEVDLNGTRAGGDAVTDDGSVKASFPEGEGNRTAETNFGDFASDAVLFLANEYSDSPVDAAIINGGSIRETLVKGDITKNDIITVFPFGNEIVLVPVTGAQLLEALEAACSSCKEPLGAFPQVAGVTFEIDVTVPYVNGAQYPNSTYYAPAYPGSRVKNVMVGGEALDLNQTYTLAASDFTAAGGDTYYVLKAPFDAAGVSTGLNMEDGLIRFITQQLGGVIGEEYAQPDGRITIVEGAGEEALQPAA